jgi:hypothetical protein
MISHAQEPDCDKVLEPKASVKPIQSSNWKVATAAEVEEHIHRYFNERERKRER